MTMLAQQVIIARMENGWLLTVCHGGSTVQLVAKEIAEVAGFIRGMEWHTPRPLPPEMSGGGSMTGANYAGQAMPAPSVYP